MPFAKNDPNINRAGRPKIGKSWAGMLREICEEEVTLGTEKKTRKEIISRRLISEAAKGEAWAINALMDRIDGKPRQVSEIDHTSGGKEITGIVREIVKAKE